MDGHVCLEALKLFASNLLYWTWPFRLMGMSIMMFCFGFIQKFFVSIYHMHINVCKLPICFPDDAWSACVYIMHGFYEIAFLDHLQPRTHRCGGICSIFMHKKTIYVLHDTMHIIFLNLAYTLERSLLLYLNSEEYWWFVLSSIYVLFLCDTLIQRFCDFLFHLIQFCYL